MIHFLFQFQRFSRTTAQLKPSSSHLGLHVVLISSQRKEGTKERKKKKGALFTKSCSCLDCPQKRSASRRIKSSAKGFTITASSAEKEGRVCDAGSPACVKTAAYFNNRLFIFSGMLSSWMWVTLSVRVCLCDAAISPIPTATAPVWLRPAGSSCE